MLLQVDMSPVLAAHSPIHSRFLELFNYTAQISRPSPRQINVRQTETIQIEGFVTMPSLKKAPACDEGEKGLRASPIKSSTYTLTRVRNNQRRHRERRRQYIASLEERLHETETLLIDAKAKIEALETQLRNSATTERISRGSSPPLSRDTIQCSTKENIHAVDVQLADPDVRSPRRSKHSIFSPLFCLNRPKQLPLLKRDTCPSLHRHRRKRSSPQPSTQGNTSSSPCDQAPLNAAHQKTNSRPRH